VVAPVDGVVLQVSVRPGERITEMDSRALMMLGDISTYHVRVDIDERDIGRVRLGAPAKAYPRGDTSHEMVMRFVRVEPYVVPKKSLTGESTERVDTRVLQVIYHVEASAGILFVGQQMDAFIDAGPSAIAAKGGQVVAQKRDGYAESVAR
jgi:HlyD family secretion protein